MSHKGPKEPITVQSVTSYGAEETQFLKLYAFITVCVSDSADTDMLNKGFPSKPFFCTMKSFCQMQLFRISQRNPPLNSSPSLWSPKFQLALVGVGGFIGGQKP